MDQGGLLFINCSRGPGGRAHPGGEAADGTSPKSVFLGPPENSLGERHLKYLQTFSRRKNNIFQVFPLLGVLNPVANVLENSKAHL